jgi:hypothetical protein
MVVLRSRRRAGVYCGVYNGVYYGVYYGGGATKATTDGAAMSIMRRGTLGCKADTK